MHIWKLLKELKKQKKITLQQYRTFKGQILSGDKEGALRGLKRKGLI